MKPTLIALTCLLIASPVWACGSYEECMERASRTLKSEIDCSSGHCWNRVEIDDREAAYKKAIAYKLDEISKKLDKETK